MPIPIFRNQSCRSRALSVLLARETLQVVRNKAVRVRGAAKAGRLIFGRQFSIWAGMGAEFDCGIDLPAVVGLDHHCVEDVVTNYHCGIDLHYAVDGPVVTLFRDRLRQQNDSESCEKLFISGSKKRSSTTYWHLQCLLL